MEEIERGETMNIEHIWKWTDNPVMDWSGIPYGLFEAMKKQSEAVTDSAYCLKNRKRERIFLSRAANKLFRQSDYRLDEIAWGEKCLNENLKVIPGNRYFMYREYDTKVTEQTYIYIDLSDDYLYRLYQAQSPILKYTAMPPNTSAEVMKVRRDKAVKFYKKCKGIFTMGQWLVDDLVSNTGIDPGKVHAIGGGCNVDISAIDRSGKQSNKILFVGKEFERKGGEVVLEAFRILKKEKKPDAELYIAGPENWPLPVEIPEGVKFLGLMRPEKLAAYYNLCDIFVMPSRSEPFGIVFAEALIFGLPCIARNAFSMKEIITEGKNGYLIDEENPVELADKMHLLLHNEDIKSYVASHQEAYRKKYSWDTIAKFVLTIIQNDR